MLTKFCFQIEYDDRAKQPLTQQQQQHPVKPPVINDSDEGEDFDIDAI